MKKYVMLLLLCCISICVGENTGSFSFLSSGFGARALGMGGAFSALADDASAMYWNPAGISGLSVYKTHVTGMYMNMDYDRLLGFAGIYERLEQGTGSIGLSVYYYRSENLDGRDESGLALGSFSFDAGVFSLTYATKLTDWLKAGLTVKYYYASSLDSTGRGFGCDAGVILKPIDPYFSIGLVVRDINLGVLWNSERNDYVANRFVLGLARDIIYERFIICAEVEADRFFSLKYRVGGEYLLNEVFSLRLGINQGDLSTGLGVVYNNYKLDYAFLLDNDGLADLHRVSFSAGF